MLPAVGLHERSRPGETGSGETHAPAEAGEETSSRPLANTNSATVPTSATSSTSAADSEPAATHCDGDHHEVDQDRPGDASMEASNPKATGRPNPGYHCPPVAQLVVPVLEQMSVAAERDLCVRSDGLGTRCKPLASDGGSGTRLSDASPRCWLKPPVSKPLCVKGRSGCCRGQQRSPQGPTRRRVNAGPGCDLIQEPVSG